MSSELKENGLVTKKDLRSIWLRWEMFIASNFNYERYFATGLIYTLTPVLKKFYGDDKERMVKALKRHMQFFNIECNFGCSVIGLVVALEEEKSKNDEAIPDEMITGVKNGLMGPMAGIGDTLWQGTLLPILLSLTLPFGQEGNIVLGPVAFSALHIGIMLSVGYTLINLGYSKGREGIVSILQGQSLTKVMTFAQTLGSIVIGALAASCISLSTPLVLHLNGGDLAIQTAVFDKIMLGILPLGATLLVYKLLKKKVNPNMVLAGIIVVIGALALLGVL